MNKFTKAEIKEKAEDTFTAIASSGVIDRQGEVVDVQGLSLKNFKQNPMILWMHDHTQPIGKATRVWVDKTGTTPLLKFKGKLTEATEQGRAAIQLIKDGIVNSFSIGFRADEIQDGNRITKGELYEISLVTIPANPEARLLAAKSLENAQVSQATIKAIIGEDEAEKDPISDLQEQLKDIQVTAEKALEQAELAVKGLQHLAPPIRSMRATASKRLALSKVIVKTADKLAHQQTQPSAVAKAQIIKRTSEKLIHNLKGDL